ncbi:MAG: hypothetical protein OXC44_03105 [Proteobacteria bacterium]|nr:hypothetical protein [Pseudomonadota bacterium]
MATSCKHQQNAHESTTNHSALASFSDRRYIFFLGSKHLNDKLLLGDNLKKNEPSYTFVICRTTLNYNKHTPKYIFDSPSQQSSNISIDENSCIPAFRLRNEMPYFFQPTAKKGLTEGEEWDMGMSLSSQSQDYSAKQPLTHHLSAFGTGATFNIFWHRGLRDLMLSALNLPQFFKASPQIPPHTLFVLSGLAVQDSLAKRFDRQLGSQYDEEDPFITEEVKHERLTSLGVAAGGFVTTRMLMKFGNKTAGNKGLIAGFLTVPFLSLFVITTQENPPEQVKRHLKKLFKTFSTHQQAINDVKTIKEDLTEFVYAFGYALKETRSGWGSDKLESYCIPSPHPSNRTTCRSLNDPYEKI